MTSQLTRMMLPLVALMAASAQDFNVELLITREVRGALWPVNLWKTPCTTQAFNASPCDCYGGASRRYSALAPARDINTSSVAIDTGSHFSGSGLYFPVFRGNVTAEHFASAGYGAWTLSYRDFSAGAGRDEPTGGALLAKYIERVRTLNPEMPAAVVTNLNLTADPYLREASVSRGDMLPPGHVSPYGLVSLPDGRTMGVLAFLDPTHLFALSPHYAARTLPFDRAMAYGLAQLARLPGGPPDVTVAVVTSAPVDGAGDFGEDLVSEHGGQEAAVTAFVRELLRPATGLDVLILGINGGEWSKPAVERNWAGDAVLVLPPRSPVSSHGVGVENASLVLGDDGRLRAQRVGTIHLSCGVAEVAEVAAQLDAQQATLDAELQGVAGHLASPLALSTRAETAAEGASPAWGSCTRLAGQLALVCGCRVSECPQGALAADAQLFASGAQLSLVNGGSLRLDELPAGPVSTADLVSLLPFLNEVVVVPATGALLRSALAHSLSKLANSDAATSPSGAYLQLGSTLRLEWYFEGGEPTLGAVEVRTPPAADGAAAAAALAARGEGYGPWAPLDDEATYSVAMSEYLVNGGDGYTQFGALDRTASGMTQTDMVATYLQHFGAAAPLPTPPAGRVTQTPDVLRLPLGLLCSSRPAGPDVATVAKREECDHARHMVDAINDKHDGLWDSMVKGPSWAGRSSPRQPPHLAIFGSHLLYTLWRSHGATPLALGGCGAVTRLPQSRVFYCLWPFRWDDLLPSALIVLNESHHGCVSGLAPAALAQLRSDLAGLGGLGGDLPALVGPSCSNDVADVAAAAARDGSGWRGVSISPSSTAPALADGEAYPNVVRLSSSEVTVAAALAALVDHYDWRRVAVLHDDSLWGKGSAEAFQAAFLRRTPDGELINCDEADAESGVCAVSLPDAAPGETRDTQFSLTEIDGGDDDEQTYCDECIVEMLRALDAKGAKVVVLATQPRVAGQIFHHVHATGLMAGEGHAWLLTWLTEDMLRNPDGSLNASVIYGAEGVLGIAESVDATTDEYAAYAARWAQHSSLAACREAGAAAYCDADGDPATLPGYSAFFADSVLAYAAAMDTLYRATPTDPDALHGALIGLGASASLLRAGLRGVSGPIALDAASGDRRGTMSVKNFQISHAADTRGRQLAAPRSAGDGTSRPSGAPPTPEPANLARRLWRRLARRLYVPLEATTADFVTVGAFDSDELLSFDSGATIYFPGRVTAVPLDAPSTRGRTMALLVSLLGGLAALLLIAFCAYRHRARTQLSSLKRELERFKDSMVGARAVLADVDPRTLARPAAAAAPAPTGCTADEAGAPSGAPETAPPPSAEDASPATYYQRRPEATRAARWYWQEDPERLAAHFGHDVRQPGNWVSYAGSVSRELEAKWSAYQAKGPLRGVQHGFLRRAAAARGGGATGVLDLTGRIASTGTEEKAFAVESGNVFEVDFEAMTQKNRKTGFSRKVLRVELEKPPAPSVPVDIGMPELSAKAPAGACTGGGKARLAAAVKLVRRSASLSSSSAAAGGDGAPPADLAGEDLLLLFKGQLVQTSKQRADGWAYGSVILDEVDDRPPCVDEGVSSNAGWFPLSATGNMSSEQLDALQKKMGGSGADAIKPPKTWASMLDPLVAKTYKVKEGPERKRVVDAFAATVPHATVLEVQRVQNVAGWQSYAVKRQTVLKRESLLSAASKAGRFERMWLFHGCQPDVVPKIVQQGFNRSFCGRNATAFGKGVYFARDASYSSAPQYSAPDANGVQHIFACRVVVGEFCQGTCDALTPNVRKGHQLYDSTVNSTKDPSIFVTYHDAQAYPEFLIKFKQ